MRSTAARSILGALAHDAFGLKQNLLDARAADAVWHRIFKNIPRAVTEHGRPERSQHGDPPLRSIGLLGRHEGEFQNIPAVEFADFNAGMERDHVGIDLDRFPDLRTVQLVEQSLEMHGKTTAIRALRLDEGKKFFVIGFANLDGRIGFHKLGKKGGNQVRVGNRAGIPTDGMPAQEEKWSGQTGFPEKRTQKIRVVRRLAEGFGCLIRSMQA